MLKVSAGSKLPLGCMLLCTRVKIMGWILWSLHLYKVCACQFHQFLPSYCVPVLHLPLLWRIL